MQLLEQRNVRVLRSSSFYITEPWGKTDQAFFVNAVIEVAFEGTAHQLLRLALDVEREMGRERLVHWGPRIIDLDILEYHGECHDTAELSLPHPFYTVRNFVLYPLAELEPLWVPTGESQTVTDIIQGLEVSYIQCLGAEQEQLLNGY